MFKYIFDYILAGIISILLIPLFLVIGGCEKNIFQRTGPLFPRTAWAERQTF